jgi:hypothetical protein
MKTKFVETLQVIKEMGIVFAICAIVVSFFMSFCMPSRRESAFDEGEAGEH